MKKTHPAKTFLQTRWALLSAVGVVLVFAGFATHQIVSAVTFTDPTCDPTTNPGACNTPEPLFLTAKTGQTGPQIIQTDIQLGQSGASKDFGLYGGITLSDSAKNISTVAGYAGQAIHATSTSDHALYGSSNGSGKAGLYGIATSASAYGVLGSSGGLNTYAIFADASSGGTAGKFIGPVVYQNGANTATLAVDGTGNLNVTTSVNGKGLTVNGIAAAGAEKVDIIPYNSSQPSPTPYDVKTKVLGNAQLAVSSIQVLFRDTTSGNRFWQPLANTAISYEECTGSSFTGQLKLTNPIAAPEYRVVIGYDPSTTVLCTGQDTTPPDSVSITGGVTSNYWYGSNVTITASATDTNGTIQKVQFFDNGVQIGADDTTAPYSVVWNAGAATPDTYVTGTTHSITARAYSNGVATPTNSTAVASVKTYATGTRQTCGNTTTCTTTAYCCLTAQTNDGQPTSPVNKCTNITVTPPSCQPASNYCGSCQGGGQIPPPEV